MKFLIAFIAFGATFAVWAGGDYVLDLDGQSFDISPDIKTNIVLQNGQSVSVTLKRKDIVTFEGQLFSFEHKSIVTPQRSEIAEDVFQTSFMVSSVGSIIIVQEYTHQDPFLMIDRMMTALTKKDVAAGYQLTEEKAERRLADGTVFIGKKVTATLGEKQFVQYVLASGENGKGILVTTHVASTRTAEDGPSVEAFWKSLKIKKTGGE